MQRTGFFITIEGVEGVGKSTVATYIKAFLEHNKKNVVLTREPGGTQLSEKIRDLLLHNEEELIFSETELLLFFAARKQHCEHLIKPAKNEGKWVVCDRFVDASYAYQGGGRKLDTKWIDLLSTFIDLPQPDLTILLNASKDIIADRLIKRATTDRIEKEKQDFFDRTKQMYLSLANKNPTQYKIIDASQELEKVQEDVAKVLMEYV